MLKFQPNRTKPELIRIFLVTLIHRFTLQGKWQNGICAKETEADIAEHVSLKGQHELQTLNLSFESACEDLSFHSFLKASDWDFEEKNGCNEHRIWFV